MRNSSNYRSYRTFGEVKTSAYVDVQKVARETISKIATINLSISSMPIVAVISAIHEQSPDINQGVEANKGLHAEQGAGDQGMMFGYATDETINYMPLALDLSHRILIELAEIRA